MRLQNLNEINKFGKLKSKMFAVKVKWGKEVFKNVEIDTTEDPILFRAQLFALTGVQPDRQKILCGGIALKEETWNISLKNVSIYVQSHWNSLNDKVTLQGAVILLLGTKEDVPVEPVDKPKFIEDMNEAELAQAVSTTQIHPFNENI